ncbi:mau2 chromatid cohesion factor homolog [Plakobranchus ocellatus]|uniref:MAU2 chromatid cohesion factor homolog n=1 Tax=Plakobranchus ocellatus TaxID=259542 RepID=A0AAV4BU91_9GAST|nr:mau2 chromatid cohesion factor homolog [Plakobranchus ocellatus]
MASSNYTAEQPWYVALLGLAEHFRTSNPPNIRLCIHCLQSIFNFNPPPHIEARTHLQLGNILLSYAKNTDIARSHLEKAISHIDDVRFESASVLAQVYTEKQNQPQNAKPILLKGIELSQQAPYWHCRLLFQLAQLHTSEKDWVAAMNIMGMGADYAFSVRSEYTRLLFMLSKGMIGLISKNISCVNEAMTQATHLIESFSGSPLHKEYLKVFFLVLQVCHYLMAGQVKSVKPVLKQLQQSIQTIAHNHSDDEPVVSNAAEMFQWLPKEHMCILVYLVTVMHSMQAGYMDKAQKYTDKALMQIAKLKFMDSNPLLSSFQLMLLEHIIMCRLIMGNKSIAIQEIFQACHVCQQQPRLFTTHGSQIHTLIGLYAMSMNCMEAAEAQFITALKMTDGADLINFIKLNLAIVYLRTSRQNELLGLLDAINPETMPTASHTLKAASYYVKGLQFFFQANFSDANHLKSIIVSVMSVDDTAFQLTTADVTTMICFAIILVVACDPSTRAVPLLGGLPR